jgi:hypothetical protein
MDKDGYWYQAEAKIGWHYKAEVSGLPPLSHAQALLISVLGDREMEVEELQAAIEAAGLPREFIPKGYIITTHLESQVGRGLVKRRKEEIREGRTVVRSRFFVKATDYGKAALADTVKWYGDLGKRMRRKARRLSQR